MIEYVDISVCTVSVCTHLSPDGDDGGKVVTTGGGGGKVVSTGGVGGKVVSMGEGDGKVVSTGGGKVVSTGGGLVNDVVRSSVVMGSVPGTGECVLTSVVSSCTGCVEELWLARVESALAGPS